jgi:hypothetical protein
MIHISFGIIALNAQPFLEYNLRALYPFAHQLLVVEGATEAARSLATEDGHSKDGTLKMLKEFRATQDSKHKLSVITAQDEGFENGFWPEKDQMSHAYAKRATGDWLWQVDSDEFYIHEDLQAVCQLLERNPQITAVSFPYLEFFGGFDYVITGKWHLIEHPRFHRLFRWASGYSYAKHRPPTVVDENGIDLRKRNWLKNPRNGNKKISLFHYSYVFPKQALQKVGYYSNVAWTDAFRKNRMWFEESYMALEKPLFLGERGKWIFQWLERFRGKHPSIIEQLRDDIREGRVKEPLRQTEDLENLLKSPIYWLITRMLRVVMPVYWRLRRFLATNFY